ncbi:MAG: hypothetical protein AAB263_16555 [Planctomycetota bacterium]
MTLRGDRGPLDREGVQALVQSGEARSEDLVRNAFGRNLGTVAEVLAAPAGTTPSDRMRIGAVGAQQPRRGVSIQVSQGSRFLVIIALIVMGFSVVAAIVVVRTSPVPRAPVPTPAPAMAPSEWNKARTSAPPVTPPQSPAAPIPSPSSPPIVVAPAPPPVLPAPPVPSPSSTKPAMTLEMLERENIVAVAQVVANGPPGWLGYAIGGGAAGTGQEFLDNTWTVRGVGTSSIIEGRFCLDRFHMVTRPWTGDGMVTARILDLQSQYPQSAACVIMRSRTDRTSPAILLMLFNNGQFHLSERAVDGGMWTGRVSAALEAGKLPCWIRLIRRGNEFSGWCSKDGSAWQQIHALRQVPAVLGLDVQAGLMVFSNRHGAIAMAKFSDVTVEPLASAPAVPAGKPTTPTPRP